MTQEEGALFLLRRVGILKPEHQIENASGSARMAAEAIVQAMDGLPLALEQAGAYIDEEGYDLASYLDLYQKRHTELLGWQGALDSDEQKTVMTTWSLSFEKVEQASAAAAELLKFCAFLHPDTIYREMIAASASQLGPVLSPIAADQFELNKAIGELRKYSLVRTTPDSTLLSMHRLVQTVLKDRMDAETRRLWAECAVRSVNQLFPDADFDAWPTCERYLPHAQACSVLINQWNIESIEAARLLTMAGRYLRDRGRYTQAESLLKESLDFKQRIFETEQLRVAEGLDDLAELYYLQEKYSKAKELFEQSLEIRSPILGQQHPDVAESLNNLALVYLEQRNYEKAEQFYQQALAIRERMLGPEDCDLAESLTNLAVLYRNQGRKEAEPLFIRSREIYEKAFARGDSSIAPTLALMLTHMGRYYYMQGRYAEAEPLFIRSQEIYEKAFGLEHPDVAFSIHCLGQLYHAQKRYAEANQLYQQARKIREQTLGLYHSHTAVSYFDIARLLCDYQHDYIQAEKLYKQALDIYKQAFGLDHLEVTKTLNYLVKMYCDQSRYTEAISTLKYYEEAMLELNRKTDAEKLRLRITEIEEIQEHERQN